MKKIFAVTILAAAIIFCAAAQETFAATPSSDTWVLNYGGANFYVKAGSFYRTDGGGNPDVAPQFECDIVEVYGGGSRSYHARFVAKGMTVMIYDGQSDSSNFADAMYNAICNKIIYRR